MSLDATRWAWQQALKPSTKLVLLALADRANDSGECWPSTARLVSDTGLNRKTAMSCTQELNNIGLITITKKTGTGNKYHINIPDTTSPKNGTSYNIDTDNQPVPKVVLPSPKNGTTTSPTLGTLNLPIEPINNLPIKTIVKNTDSTPQKPQNETQADPVTDIFKFWQIAMNHPNAVFDNKRKSTITKALKNYNAEQLKAAITGCAKSAWHMGKNDKQKVYDGLDLIFRNADKIEGFIQNSIITPAKGVTTHATKHQQSTNITEQIFGAAAQIYDSNPAGIGGNGCLVFEDDRYLPQSLD